MSCCGVRGSGEQEARVRQGLSFSLAQTGLESGDSLAGCGTFGSLPTPALTLEVSSSLCGVAPWAKGAKCPTVLGAMRTALFKPLFLDNSAALDLCAATLPLALGRGADAWEKHQCKCDYVGVRAWVSLAAQPRQPCSISRAKMAVGKKIPAFWSPMQCCVSPALGEAVGKTVSPQSCSPDLAFSMPGIVCAL